MVSRLGATVLLLLPACYVAHEPPIVEAAERPCFVGAWSCEGFVWPEPASCLYGLPSGAGCRQDLYTIITATGMIISHTIVDAPDARQAVFLRTPQPHAWFWTSDGTSIAFHDRIAEDGSVDGCCRTPVSLPLTACENNSFEGLAGVGLGRTIDPLDVCVRADLGLEEQLLRFAGDHRDEYFLFDY